MSNKKIAIIICIFIIIFMAITGIIALSGHLPVIGKSLVFIFVVILVLFVLTFFIVIGRKKK